MKNLNILLVLATLVASCHKAEHHSCICTFSDGKVYKDHDLAKGWTKKVKNYCQNQLGAYGDSIGVTCRMYSNEDQFTRCLDVSKTNSEKDDTGYFFSNMTAAEEQQFIKDHTYTVTLPGNEKVEHYAICSSEWGALF